MLASPPLSNNKSMLGIRPCSRADGVFLTSLVGPSPHLFSLSTRFFHTFTDYSERKRKERKIERKKERKKERQKERKKERKREGKKAREKKKERKKEEKDGEKRTTF